MKLILQLAAFSIWNRRLTSALTLGSIALSVALLIGVERIRQGAREGFAGTISQTDLIVGAKGGTYELLLYTIFHMGNAVDNISYESYRHWDEHPEVAWTIPISLGDSHRGFRVVGTNDHFYEHYRYRQDRGVLVSEGRKPAGVFEVVIGSVVAKQLGYHLGQKLTLSHGVSEVSLQHHDDKPFEVVGVLQATGTPIDRSLFVSLQAIEAIHVDWGDGAPPMRGQEVSKEEVLQRELPIKQISAFLLGAKTRIATLQLQRDIGDYTSEPLMAVIPGVVLSELWSGLSYVESGLLIVSAFVVLVGILGMGVSLYTTLNERRREMAILRSVGAGPGVIVSLLLLESVVLTLLGIGIGCVGLLGSLILLRPILENWFGMHIPVFGVSSYEWMLMLGIVLLGTMIGFIPAVRAYKNTLVDGLTLRL